MPQNFANFSHLKKTRPPEYSVFYGGEQAMFRDLGLARADGSLRHLLARLGRIDVMMIDDWAMAPMTKTEWREFWEICEDR